MPRGFTLLEILISLGIITAMLLMLGALVKVSSLQALAQAEELALTIATDTLENLRVGGYASLPASGALVNPSLALLYEGSGTMTITTYDAKTKKVEVVVLWTTKGGESRSMTLSTLIAETGGLL
jgi:prepilin-type N-terminal cleavage/methylation domain-containing protein